MRFGCARIAFEFSCFMFCSFNNVHVNVNVSYVFLCLCQGEFVLLILFERQVQQAEQTASPALNAAVS